MNTYWQSTYYLDIVLVWRIGEPNPDPDGGQTDDLNIDYVVKSTDPNAPVPHGYVSEVTSYNPGASVPFRYHKGWFTNAEFLMPDGHTKASNTYHDGITGSNTTIMHQFFIYSTEPTNNPMHFVRIPTILPDGTKSRSDDITFHYYQPTVKRDPY